MAISGLSTSYANTILDSIFSGTVYFGLSTTTPNEDGTGVTEPSGNGYARVAVPSSDMNAAASATADNANDIEFAVATGSWGTITYLVVYSAISGGTLLFAIALTASKAISSGETPRFPAGDFDLSAQ